MEKRVKISENLVEEVGDILDEFFNDKDGRVADGDVGDFLAALDKQEDQYAETIIMRVLTAVANGEQGLLPKKESTRHPS